MNQGRRGLAGSMRVWLIPALAVGGGCKKSAEDGSTPAAAKVFTEVTAQAGLTHRHHKPVLDHKLDNVMPWVCSVGAAAAAGDYNNDGLLDLYVTNSKKGTPNFLYRNNGDGTFTDVAVAAGVAKLNGEAGTSMDCVWGDLDNDGWADLYVVRWGNDALFHNNGDGTFSDVTAERFRKRGGSPGTDWANGCAALLIDYDRDGRLDLYVGNYFDEVDLWHLKSTRIMHDDFEKARNGGRNYLYHQKPDGGFEEVAASLGVDDPGWTLAVGSADINNDGWADLYCADDFGPDQLFINRGDGTFANVSATALGFDTKKGMNVDFGDFNNDGWLDVYVSNITTAEYLQEGNMLWYNNGPGPDGRITLTDVAMETGTYDGGWGWGAKFFDYDNDADLDIVAVNGFISAGQGNYWYDLASWTVLGQDSADAANWPRIGDMSFSGYEALRFWRNDGMHVFTSAATGIGLETDRDGRGVVCFDYDNDGDLDLFIANHDQPPQLFRNDGTAGNHWLMFELVTASGTGVNRDAIGARVTVVTASARQIRERDGGNGYSAQSDPRLHFGLGSEGRAELVEIRWPDGGLQYLENIQADRVVTVTQDPAHYASRVALVTQPPAVWKRKETQPARVVHQIDAAKRDELLAHMESHLREEGGLTYALHSTYRRRCVGYDLHDRSIGFLEKLVEERPDGVWARIALACAYVDKLPTCGGIAAVVSKGRLARKSLDQLDEVIEKHKDLWAAYYCRGMNHLHWPKALRHSDDAAVDFETCLRLQNESQNPAAKRYYERTHILLGDAYAKNEQFQEARRAWQQGLALFPNSKELKQRLGMKDNDALLEFIKDQRSLESPIDTDLTFLDREP
ncbi:MAG: FG-GAP-like repeat-containing protein [Phycisphaerae bacterium]